MKAVSNLAMSFTGPRRKGMLEETWHQSCGTVRTRCYWTCAKAQTLISGAWNSLYSTTHLLKRHRWLHQSLENMQTPHIFFMRIPTLLPQFSRNALGANAVLPGNDGNWAVREKLFEFCWLPLIKLPLRIHLALRLCHMYNYHVAIALWFESLQDLIRFKKDCFFWVKSRVLSPMYIKMQGLTWYKMCRDDLLGSSSQGPLQPAQETSRTAELDNKELVQLQRQVMREQDEDLDELERTVGSTKVTSD